MDTIRHNGLCFFVQSVDNWQCLWFLFYVELPSYLKPKYKTKGRNILPSIEWNLNLHILYSRIKDPGWWQLLSEPFCKNTWLAEWLIDWAQQQLHDVEKISNIITNHILGQTRDSKHAPVLRLTNGWSLWLPLSEFDRGRDNLHPVWSLSTWD